LKFEERFRVDSDRESLWELLMDVHKVATCLSGVEDLTVLQPDEYEGVLPVSMGPVKLKFKGRVTVTLRDKERWTAILEAKANDSRAGGGFKASLQMQLIEATDSALEPASDLMLKLETTFLGRIGELGRPLIKRKINSIMRDFSETLNASIGAISRPISRPISR